MYYRRHNEVVERYAANAAPLTTDVLQEMMKLDEVPFDEPWELLGDPELPSPAKLESELSRELAPGHVLEGKTFQAVARRFDVDDVLFHITSPDEMYAVVHLTWSSESDPRWPLTETFSTLEQFVSQRMKPDIEMY